VSRVQVRPTAKTRQRRRRRRAITLLVYIVIVGLLAWYFQSQGTTTIVFVRHAETDLSDSLDADTPLNAAGQARARQLADTLVEFDVDGSVNAIYVDQTLRTWETAQPLADRIGLPVEVADHTDVAGFMREVETKHKRQIILVVTQPDILASLIEELHGKKGIGKIPPDKYDDLFIVVSPWQAKVKTLRLPY
jgi:phosphohistidine phosphatase SixA